MGVGVAVVGALAASYLLGRVRLWRRLGDWAVDEFRFTGPWVLGGRGRQAVLILAHLLTEPRTSRQIARAPTTKTPPRAPAAMPASTGHDRQPFESHPGCSNLPP